MYIWDCIYSHVYPRLYLQLNFTLFLFFILFYFFCLEKGTKLSSCWSENVFRIFKLWRSNYFRYFKAVIWLCQLDQWSSRWYDFVDSGIHCGWCSSSLPDSVLIIWQHKLTCLHLCLINIVVQLFIYLFIICLWTKNWGFVLGEHGVNSEFIKYRFK